MPKRARNPDEFDSPWKDVLQRHLQAFLEFFFTDIAADIDWARGYESLDKELQKIARRAKVGKLLADKLFKVWLNDGGERWLLIHVEVQNQFDKDFAARMFHYNVAAYQMYNNPVVSLAALCDDRLDWRPTRFSYGMWGCTTEVTFRITKLLDFSDDIDSLETNGNPFAVVVLTNRKAIETRDDVQSRIAWKLRIVKGLYRRNWSKEEVREFFYVIDLMMKLPKEFEPGFAAEVEAYEEEQKVKYVSSIERVALNRAREEGVEKGIEKGLREGIAVLLEGKFGASGLELLPGVQSLDRVDKLRVFLEATKNAASLAELRAFFE